MRKIITLVLVLMLGLVPSVTASTPPPATEVQLLSAPVLAIPEPPSCEELCCEAGYLSGRCYLNCGDLEDVGECPQLEARCCCYLSAATLGCNEVCKELGFDAGRCTPNKCEPTEKNNVQGCPTSTEHCCCVRSEEAISVCKADMAERLGITTPEEIKVDGTPEFHEWLSTACGCPDVGMMYAQVITPGWKIFLRGGGWTFEYHTGEPQGGSPRIVRLCRRIKTRIYLPLVSRP